MDSLGRYREMLKGQSRQIQRIVKGTVLVDIEERQRDSLCRSIRNVKGKSRKIQRKGKDTVSADV